jgi:CheY-like chemotaxis protein
MDTNQKHLLLVEDDRDILEVLRDLLESEGYHVDCAQNGLQALELLKSLSTLPGLILLDLMMPVMDGFEFRQKQKEDPRFSKIPLIVMSADGQSEARWEKSGIKGFLKKPLDLLGVLSTIEKGFDGSVPTN